MRFRLRADAAWVGWPRPFSPPHRVAVLMFLDRSNLGANPGYGRACLEPVGYVAGSRTVSAGSAELGGRRRHAVDHDS